MCYHAVDSVIAEAPVKQRPSCRENFHRRSVINSSDDDHMITGSEYPYRQYSSLRFYLPAILIVLFGAIRLLLRHIWSVETPLNIYFDFGLLSIFITEAVSLIRFRRAHATAPDSKTAGASSNPERLKTPRAQRAAAGVSLTVITALLVAFLFLNSACFAALRSLVIAPQITEVRLLYIKDGDVSPQGAELPLPPKETESARLAVTVAGTLKPASFSLSGKPLDPLLIEYPSFFFWQPAFPVRYTLRLEGLTEGSVLTLTCGSMRREWVLTAHTE